MSPIVDLNAMYERASWQTANMEIVRKNKAVESKSIRGRDGLDVHLKTNCFMFR